MMAADVLKSGAHSLFRIFLPMTDRPPLLFLPGLLCDDALWAHQTKHLADITQPRVMNITKQDSVTQMARHVLEEAPPRFALAGLSMGGYVALEIMRLDPSRVVRLALVNTSARADTPENLERRKGFIALAKTGKFKGVTPKLLPYLIHESRISDPEVGEVVLKMAERVGRDAFIRQQTAIMTRIDSRPSLANIQVPTLMIVGRQDITTPPAVAEEIVTGVKGAKLALIEDCGHLSPLERPQAVTALLRMWMTP